MTTWLTSDNHFDHENIIKYCNRPFSNVDEMNSIIIVRWNELVKPNDIVFHLGDFTLGGVDIAAKFFQQLNGHIKILGCYWHHDTRWLKSGKMIYVSANGHTVEILPPMVVLEDMSVNTDGRGVPLVLCHYPIAEWDRKHHGSFHAHGHSHGNYVYPPKTLALDVGVDCTNFYPISIGDAIKRMLGFL